MTDLITTVARARASMMVRGYRSLRLRLGPDMWSALAQEAELQGIFTPNLPPPRVLFGMPIEVEPQMEGWAVEIREACPDGTGAGR